MNGQRRGLREAAEEAAQERRRRRRTGRVAAPRRRRRVRRAARGHRPQRARAVDVLQRDAGKAGVSRTTETKRAASSEWPPRSVKKSASSGIGWLREARAWRRRAAPPRSRCAAAPARRRRAATVSGAAFSALRSTLPEVRRGSVADRLEMRRHHVGRQLLGAAPRAARAPSTATPRSGTTKATSRSMPSSLRSTTAACADAGLVGELRLRSRRARRGSRGS